MIEKREEKKEEEKRREEKRREEMKLKEKKEKNTVTRVSKRAKRSKEGKPTARGDCNWSSFKVDLSSSLMAKAIKNEEAT